MAKARKPFSLNRTVADYRRLSKALEASTDKREQAKLRAELKRLAKAYQKWNGGDLDELAEVALGG